MESRTMIGIIGDEDTLTGFMIAGIENSASDPNLIQVTKNTCEKELKNIFISLSSRKDLALLLICDFAAEKIRDTIDHYDNNLPSVLEIPSKVVEKKM